MSIISAPAPTPTLKYVFVVPYRNRREHYEFHYKHMTETVLKNIPQEEYKILYVHQCDNRLFNRGAMKNIGFLYIKNAFPETYKHINFIFNDVDIMPREPDVIDFETQPNKIKHYYGYNYALGGLVSIKGGDFEMIGGFPNFWAWGYEDTLLNLRAQKAKIEIDRTQFYPVQDTSVILQLSNPTKNKLVSETEYTRARYTQEGYQHIYNIEMKLDETNGFLNVYDFKTNFSPDKIRTHEFNPDYNQPFTTITAPRNARVSMSMTL